MLSTKKYRLPIHNLVLRPMIKRLSRKYFGHVNKPSTAASASHRHYIGFPNYVLTYSLTYLLTTRQQSGFRFYEAETTKTRDSVSSGYPNAEKGFQSAAQQKYCFMVDRTFAPKVPVHVFAYLITKALHV